MTNILTFPVDLPNPVLGSDNITFDLGLENTAMSSGFMRQRRIYDNIPARSSISLRLDSAQAVRFIQFVDEAAGASFDMDAQVPENPLNPLSTVSARFIGEPESIAINSHIRLYTVDVFIEQTNIPFEEITYTGWNVPSFFYMDEAGGLIAVSPLVELPDFAGATLPDAHNGLDQAGAVDVTAIYGTRTYQLTFNQSANVMGTGFSNGQPDQLGRYKAGILTGGVAAFVNFARRDDIRINIEFVDYIDPSYGQSLRTGRSFAGDPVITTVAPLPSNILMFGFKVYRPLAVDYTAGLKPAIERQGDTEAGSAVTLTETGCVIQAAAYLGPYGQGRDLTSLVRDTRAIVGSFARGGQELAVLRKGDASGYYDDLIEFIQAANDAAVADDQTPKMLWLNFAHGEQDTAIETTRADYKAGMLGLWAELNTDVKAITGQTEDITIIMQQTGRLRNGVIGGPSLATLDLAMENPDKFRSIGPNFMLDDWADTQHLTARGYYRKGHAFAEACADLVHFERVKVPPVAFVQAKKTSTTTINLVGHPHWGPVYADISVVSDPGNYGIEVLNSSGVSLAISSVTWVDNVVIITMADTLPAGPSVRIAGVSGNDQQGPTTGARTPLRVQGDVNCMDGYAMGRYFHHQQITVDE